MAARDTANALRTLVGASRGVSSNLQDLESQLRLLETSRDVMDKSVNLMQEAKRAVEDPDNPENRQRLAQVVIIASVISVGYYSVTLSYLKTLTELKMYIFECGFIVC